MVKIIIEVSPELDKLIYNDKIDSNFKSKEEVILKILKEYYINELYGVK